MIVVDASAVVEFLLGSKRGGAIQHLLPTSADRVTGLHTPSYLDVEVANSLRRMELAGTLSPDRAARSLADLIELPILRHRPTLLLPRIWHHRHNLTAYDAAYIALAEALQCPVLTCDEKLGRAPGVTAEVWVASP